MTGIVSIIIAFMATFVLAFSYLTYTEEAPEHDEAQVPAVEMPEDER